MSACDSWAQGILAHVNSAPGSGAPDALHPGAVLAERFEVVGEIGVGSMGAVYRCVDRRDGSEVAVKRLLDQSQEARFEIEARLLASLRHPRIVSAREYFTDPSGDFFSMEFVSGPNLAELLDRDGDPGLPLEDVLTYVEQACEALDYVHRQRIVHRDIKPQNLILADRGVILVDFGVARELDWRSGTAGVGTPGLMAPEVFAGGAVSDRSDIYSLAATAWTLLNGSPPGYTRRGSLKGVPPWVEQALLRALEFMPEQRTPSAVALVADLKRRIVRDLGSDLALSVPDDRRPASLLEAVVRTAAGVFDAAAASIALLDEATGEAVFHAAWGAGAREIVGVRLARGQGIAGSVLLAGEPIVVPQCRSDSRFASQVAAGTGYVPVTLLVVPLRRGSEVSGVLSLLDRRDGTPYGADDVGRAELFGELAAIAVDLGPTALAGHEAD